MMNIKRIQDSILESPEVIAIYEESDVDELVSQGSKKEQSILGEMPNGDYVFAKWSVKNKDAMVGRVASVAQYKDGDYELIFTEGANIDRVLTQGGKAIKEMLESLLRESDYLPRGYDETDAADMEREEREMEEDMLDQ